MAEFAALSGLPGARNSPPLDTHKVRSISKRTLLSDESGGRASHDPNEDDDVLPSPSLDQRQHSHHDSGESTPAFGTSRSPHFKAASQIAAHEELSFPHILAQPKITVRAEHKAIARNADRGKKTNVTCMVTVEMPSRLEHAPLSRTERSNSVFSNPPLPEIPKHDTFRGHKSGMATDQHQQHGFSYATTNPAMTNSSPSKNGSSQDSNMSETFDLIVKDLTARMVDWKGHSPEDFGKLYMYDLLQIRKEKKVLV